MVAFLHHQIFAATFLLLFVILSACSPNQPEPLRVGSIPWPGYETLFLARELGFYEATAVRLIELSTSTETLRAFRQKQLEVAALTLDEAIRLSQTEDDLLIILVTNISNGADKLITRPDITRISDLKGKRIGFEEGAVGVYMLYQTLQLAGLTLADITPVPSTVNQHVYLMQSGQVDAVVSFDPVAYKLEQTGFHRLADSSMIEDKIIDVLVTRKSTMTGNPKAIDALLKGYWKALSFIDQNSEEAYQLIAPRLGLAYTDLEVIYAGLIQPDETLQQQFFEHDLFQAIEAHNRFMLTHDIVTTPADADALIGNND